MPRKKRPRKRSRLLSKGAIYLKNIIEDAETMTDVLKHFDLCKKGGNYNTLQKIADEIGADLTKIKTKRMDRRISALQKHWRRIPLNKKLVQHSTYTNMGNLKRALLKVGLLKERCAVCGLGPSWRESPLTLQLDHINGIGNDHRLKNLRLLCPNCHSQTPSFAGRKNRKHK